MCVGNGACHTTNLDEFKKHLSEIHHTVVVDAEKILGEKRYAELLKEAA